MASIGGGEDFFTHGTKGAYDFSEVCSRVSCSLPFFSTLLFSSLSFAQRRETDWQVNSSPDSSSTAFWWPHQHEVIQEHHFEKVGRQGCIRRSPRPKDTLKSQSEEKG
jgi:hypothetical protein